MGNAMLYGQARDVLARHMAAADSVDPVALGRDWFVYTEVLLEIVKALQHGECRPVLLLEPRTRIEPNQGEWLVYGWLHVVRYDHSGAETPLEYPVSSHIYRWAARRAARKWIDRARLVRARLLVELGGY